MARPQEEWWRARGIPVLRDSLEETLREARADIPEELLYRNLGLSLSDQYWIRPKDVGLSWEDVSFFLNDFEASGRAIESVRPSIGGSGTPLAHPDNTSDGNLEKHWILRDRKRLLLKAGLHNGQEPYNEVVATALHRRLLEPGAYVSYSMETARSPLCVCENFLGSTEEYVPACHVSRLLEQDMTTNDYDHYVACCAELGVADIERALAQMIVCDDIIANHDRHWRNFGIVRDVETLECRAAPLFDSGSSLWCDLDMDRLVAEGPSFASKPFDERPSRQLMLVDDLSWACADALDGFVDEAISILGGNEWLASRLPAIRSALEKRVRRMADIIEWS